jgi:hypothetical protein
MKNVNLLRLVLEADKETTTPETEEEQHKRIGAEEKSSHSYRRKYYKSRRVAARKAKLQKVGIGVGTVGAALFLNKYRPWPLRKKK